MRILHYLSDTGPALAVVAADHTLFSLQGTPWAHLSMIDILGMTTQQQHTLAADVQAQSSTTLSMDQVQYVTPVLRPGKVVCLGLNYYDHAAESGHSKPEYPSFFLRAADSLLPHAQPMIRPACSIKLDYEAELAVIIGTQCRHASVDQALSFVGGYSCFNDGSLRDYQHKTSQWTLGKNFDATGAFGPVLVTPDELPAGASGLDISTRLNGQIMQSDNTRNMVFTVAEAIAMLSQCMTLYPGDVIAMGTPAGVGSARKPPVWMKEGDTVEICIEGIGTLRNPVHDEVPVA